MFRQLHPDAKLPTRAHATDAGLDLYSIDEIILPGMMGLYQKQLKNLFDIMMGDKYVPSHMINSLFDLTTCTHQFRTGVGIDLSQIGTGLGIGSVGLLWDKSGIGNKCNKLFGGVIDYGYEGEILVRLMNFGAEDWVVHKGMKICQILIQPTIIINDYLTKWTSPIGETSERGTTGFGASGL